ncbi:Os08g0149800, partial [Oryza sativa Japonica Group]
YRFFIWLSYLASDALAVYALATLFNRKKKLQHDNNGSHDLEVVWAPILLMHLGGQMFITAYNIEDNELWRRHILTALSQVLNPSYFPPSQHISIFRL